MPLIDYVRLVNAQQNFKISPDFEVKGFDDISKEIVEDSDTSESLEVWAQVEISFDGTIPESYKTLNLLIGDWVIENKDPLTKTIHEKLDDFLKANYPDSDTSDLKDFDNTSIWLEQLDYMPRTEEGSKKMVIEIDLVLHAEQED